MPDLTADPTPGPTPHPTAEPSAARVAALADAMAAADLDRAVQEIQTLHRTALVRGWGIEPGARILEIGCGQGDMTAVLADAVGPRGHVLAVDVADPSYGAPVTVGESAARLGSGPLGSRIAFRFGFDVLDAAGEGAPAGIADGAFDCVVLAHCSWYFDSAERIGDTLARVRPWARTLCFAEWDLTPRAADRIPHLLAVLAQGQAAAYGHGEGANVRMPMSREALHELLGAAGWSAVTEERVDTTGLQDADWEIAICRDMYAALDPGSAVARALRPTLDTLGSLALSKGNRTLDAYVLTAR
ncbi:methyltransferase domain-containing protein [Streptomyces sp. G-G2]|uniref:class I SAM-dependent methyltransferase n=1 Tax=Streptomyces sp. G-G2 TaxID=3046201 RepID=UPI0024BBC67D|nr:methyltransferase domain-containing protein [Streptomyces sp. G-G2]MDJ0380047.1 methyltransferase domain-containing protein [Streptomyces sp. G-G2]